MPVNKEAYQKLIKELNENGISLIAVSKTKPLSDIFALYEMGHRDFGENYVQELANKHAQLPPDIHWHFIGHLQSNKVKTIAPFVHLIHGVDSSKLLQEINKQGEKNERIIDVLLQVHIAQEETKFGLDEKELEEILKTNSGRLHELKNIRVRGLMGMASFTDDTYKIKNEFRYLKSLFDKCESIGGQPFNIISMGMSSDYKIAIEEGSNMVRIGSLIFGERLGSQ